MRQKFWQKGIVGIIMIGIFLLPISAGIDIKENKLALSVGINEVRAQATTKQEEYQKALQEWLIANKNLQEAGKNNITGDELVVLKNTEKEKRDKKNELYNTLTEEERLQVAEGLGLNSNQPDDEDYIKCISFTNFSVKGCVASFFLVFWELSAKIAKVAGRFLDFFIYYSINSSSYDNEFVEKGWGVVRDVANIFFIIMLIYIAIKTVLSLNVTNNKKLIGAIVVVALLINFSLFTTKVIIDASNILAKIFYNNITSQGPNGEKLDPKAGGEKSISIGMVAKFNPQTIINKETYDGGKGVGIFIFVTIISLIITLYMAYIFFSVALLFVARVVSLWLSMILSPLAFISYTVPLDMGSLGHQKWWTELFKNAFLAPLFIFFLYLIVLFLDILKDLTYNDNDPLFGKLMGVVIPFAILFILLMKAKKLAVEYSGEMGAGITKAGSMIGGFAGGAVLGGAAVLGSGVIGGGAAKLMSKYGERLKGGGYTTDKDGNVIAKKGFGAYFSRMALKSGDYTTKASFDIRKTKAGSQLSSATGLNLQSASLIGLGSKEGGYKGAGERAFQKLEKEKELYKTTMNDTQVKAWSDKRIVEYYKDKKEMTGSELKKKWGENPPKEYSKAEELNRDRMIAFRDNLGHTGLLGTLGYYAAKQSLVDKNNFAESKEYIKEHKQKAENEARLKYKENFDKSIFENDYTTTYDESIIKNINNKRIGTAKAILGVGAAAVVGGGVGGLIGGTVVAKGVGSGLGTLAAAREGWVQDSGEGKMVASINKELIGFEKINRRIEELDKVLKEAKGLERTITTPSALIGQPPIIKIEKLNIVDDTTGKINTEKLKEVLADNESMQFAERAKLNKNPDDKNAQTTLRNLIKEKEVLNNLKTYEKELLDLLGKKGELNKTISPPTSGK